MMSFCFYMSVEFLILSRNLKNKERKKTKNWLNQTNLRYHISTFQIEILLFIYFWISLSHFHIKIKPKQRTRKWNSDSLREERLMIKKNENAVVLTKTSFVTNLQEAEMTVFFLEVVKSNQDNHLCTNLHSNSWYNHHLLRLSPKLIQLHRIT